MAAAVCGTSSIARFSLLVRLVPCYPVCRPAFVNYAPPLGVRQYETKQVKPARHPPTPHDSFHRLINRRNKEKGIERKTQRIERKKEDKGRPRLNQLHQLAAQVAWTCSTSCVGLVPCYPVCHLLPTFVHRSSPSTPPVPPLLAFPWSSFLPLLLLPPLPPFPWIPPTPDARRCLLSSASSSCHLTMDRSAASRTPRYHFPAFFDAVDHSAVSTPSTKGASSVDPSVARNSRRSSTMDLCQVLNCPPCFGFSPSAIISNIA